MAREVRFGIRLTGDSKGAVNAMRLTDKELSKLRREMNRTDRSVQKHRRGLQGWANGLLSVRRVLAPLAGVAGVSMLARTTRNVIEQTAAISESADVAGISAERLQELSKAFADMGGATEQETAAALRRFNRRLGLAAEGAGAARNAFGDMGVAMRTVGGNLRSTEDVLGDMLRALSGVENEAERAAQASLVFGEDAGPRLAAVLGQGEQALQDQIRSLREHGRILENETVAKAREANDVLNAMRDRIGTRMNRAILENAESYMALADALSHVAEWGLDAAGAIGNIFEELQRGGTAPGILENLEEVQQRLDRVRERLSGVSPERQPGLFRDLTELEAQLDREARELEERLLRRTEDFDPIVVSAPVRVAPELEEPGLLPPAGGESESDDLADRFRKLADRLDPVTASTRMYMEQVALLDEAWARAHISGERHWELLNRLATSDIEAEQRDPGRLIFGGELWENREQIAEDMERLVDSTGRLNDLGDSLGMSFASSFEEAILGGNQFRDVLAGMRDDLLRIGIRTAITAPLADAAGDFFGSLLGRSGGGAVSGGTGYIVGERGPEMFVPRTNGTVIPNNAMGGVQVNVINNVGAEVTTREHATPQGPQIDVMIDRAVARSLSERGTDSNRALRSTFGTRPVLAGR